MNMQDLNDAELVEYFAMKIAPRCFEKLYSESVILPRGAVRSLESVAEKAMREAYRQARALAEARSAIRREQGDKDHEALKAWGMTQNMLSLLDAFSKERVAPGVWAAEDLFSFIAGHNRVGAVFGQEKALSLEKALLIKELENRLQSEVVRIFETPKGVSTIHVFVTPLGLRYAVEEKPWEETCQVDESSAVNIGKPCVAVRIESLKGILEVFAAEQMDSFSAEELFNFIGLLGQCAVVFAPIHAQGTPGEMIKDLHWMLRRIREQGQWVNDGKTFQLSRSRLKAGTRWRLSRSA